MNRLRPALLYGMGSLILASSSWGQAVSVDATSLMKRLEAIEARLSAAENRRAASAGAATTAIPGTAGYTAGLDQRIEEIETEASQLRGANDRATLAIERLAKRLDDFAKDMDMRMGDLEARVDDLAEKAGPGPGAGPVETPVMVVPTTSGTAVVSPSKAVTPTTAAGAPAGLSASDHYNKAYAYLTATDYKNAQVWFEDFLKKHSKDALADNAYYWLGEVYLVQNNPAAAVEQFRNGIKAFPKGSKVTANLFKMGVALEQLKQPKLAKAAWEKLLKDYPTAPEAARAKDKLIQLKA